MRLASLIASAFSGGGGGGLVPPPAKPAAYDADFNGLANGTLLFQQSGWSAVNSTNPVANLTGRNRLNVQSGDLYNDTAISNGPNTWIVGYTCQTTDHGIEFTLGTLGTDGGKLPDVALAATDQNNYISCEFDMFTDQYTIKTVTAGVTTNISTGGRILGTLSSFYSGVVGSVLGRALQAGDRLKWQIHGTIVQLYVNGYPCLGAGVDITAGGYTKGVLCGFHTSVASSNFFLRDLRVADVQARLNVNFVQEFWPALISVGSRTWGVNGTYNGTLASLQYRVVRYADGAEVQGWQALASPSISAGVWSGNVTAPIGNLTTQDSYRIEFRSGSDMDVKCSTNEFAVGVAVAIYGQSNILYRYDGGIGGGGVTAFNVNRNGYHYNDNLGSTNTRSTRWRRPSGVTSTRKADALPDQLSKLVGIPVGVVCGGRGGTTINDLADYAGASSPSWTAYMLNMINASAANGYIYGWIWDHGEADGTTSNGLAAYYNPRYTQLLTLMRGVSVNSNVPVVNAIPGENFNVNNVDNWAGMRRNLSLLPSLFANVFTAHSWWDLPNVDALHHTDPAYVRANVRAANSLARAMGYSVAYSGRGPNVTGAIRSGATITLALNLDGAISVSGTGLTDFEVSTNNFSSTLAISSVNVVSNQIVITLAADPAAVCQVRSHWALKSGAGTVGASAAVMAIASYPDGNTIAVEPLYNAISTNV